MSLNSSQLDRRITIQRATTAVDGFNEAIEAWSDIATIWAKRRDVSDSAKIEFLAAGQIGSFAAARFTVRSSTLTRTITPVDRMIHDGRVWAINGVKEADEGRRRFIEITASRDAD
ncbi:phage head-tail joining protein [Rhizobium rhizosphaerae]|uniref:Phage head-tail joining protein n=1 Tax=Xaviernesmea rhizosphaerae TaxID=1672749 RepID=A0A1Q9AMN2_9HYPH|nr:phage head closure protein [Xaviernesmea rhizosphaerae]OLP56667.1 phage head-tail joining protein [Xaviernesmea rhizosphaerae]